MTVQSTIRGPQFGTSGVVDLRFEKETVERLEAIEKPPRVEVSGEIVMPKLAPGERAKLGIATVNYDTAGWWDAVNKRYTPKLAGTYWVNCFISDSSAATLANHFMGVWILRNAAVIGGIEGFGEYRLMQNGVAEAGLQGGYSLLAVMNGTTDFLEIFGNLSDPTAGRKSRATMSAFRIGK